MPPWVLVCGSVAMDYVGRYRGSFASYQSRYDIEALKSHFSWQTCVPALVAVDEYHRRGLRKLDIACDHLFQHRYQDFLIITNSI